MGTNARDVGDFSHAVSAAASTPTGPTADELAVIVDQAVLASLGIESYWEDCESGGYACLIAQIEPDSRVSVIVRTTGSVLDVDAQSIAKNVMIAACGEAPTLQQVFVYDPQGYEVAYTDRIPQYCGA